jgi:hypothetical protein
LKNIQKEEDNELQGDPDDLRVNPENNAPFPLAAVVTKPQDNDDVSDASGDAAY